MDAMTVIGLLRASADPDQWRGQRLTFGWVKAVVDRLYLLLAACAGLGLVIGVDYYFRKGASEGQLGRRVRRVLGIELIVALAVWLISVLLTWLIVELPA